jgi:DNA-binding NarL/FixJ family response regulator
MTAVKNSLPCGPPVLPLATDQEPVRYVVIDDEPRYRHAIEAPGEPELLLVGGYGSIEAFLGVQHMPCHVVVLDLCLNRQTGDKAVLQGVLAIRHLAACGHRVLILTAEDRPEPVARCVAAGAVGYISKYGDTIALVQAIDEVGRRGSIVTDALHDALRALLASCRDIRLPAALEETLALLDSGKSDKQLAEELNLSARTIEDHKRKILQIIGEDLERRHHGSFADLARELGVRPGDLVNDTPARRVGRGLIARAMPWKRLCTPLAL